MGLEAGNERKSTSGTRGKVLMLRIRHYSRRC